MKSLKKFIMEATDCGWWCSRCVCGKRGTKEEMDIDTIEDAKWIKKNMGTCPKAADPKGLFKGVTNISGERRNKNNVCVVYGPLDKDVFGEEGNEKNPKPNRYTHLLSSIVFVGDNTDDKDREKWDEYYHEGHPTKYLCMTGEVKEVRGEKVFSEYLS